jgi:hypothetical protein
MPVLLSPRYPFSGVGAPAQRLRRPTVGEVNPSPVHPDERRSPGELGVAGSFARGVARGKRSSAVKKNAVSEPSYEKAENAIVAHQIKAAAKKTK